MSVERRVMRELDSMGVEGLFGTRAHMAHPAALQFVGDSSLYMCCSGLHLSYNSDVKHW